MTDLNRWVQNVAARLIEYAADTRADRPAVICDGRITTYGLLKTKTNVVATRLQKMGCKPEDRVLIAVRDPVDFSFLCLGAMLIGAIPVPIDPNMSEEVYRNHVERVTPRFSIIDGASDLVSRYGPLSVAVSDLCTSATNEGDIGSGCHFMTSPEDSALIMHTSGTSGIQKAVVHSHKAILGAADRITRFFDFGPEDRILCLPRPWYSFGFGFGMCFPLFAGCCTITTVGQLSPQNIAEIVRKYRPTVLIAVPSALAALLNVSRDLLLLDLSSTRFIVSAGEHLPAPLFEKFKERFGVEVLDGIGSTELMTHFISNRPGGGRSGSCGTAIPGCEISLLDEEGFAVEPGRVGSLAVQVDTALAGYWDRDNLVRIAKTPHGVLTGDKLYCDQDGFYYYCGRSDDMIKIAGAWVSPNELQTLLARHPSVENAFVTTSERDGRKRLAAYVVPRRGTIISKVGLLRYLSDLPPHMLPASIVVLDELPLTGNGKVSRRDLPRP